MDCEKATIIWNDITDYNGSPDYSERGRTTNGNTSLSFNVGFGDASVIISDTATFLVECDGLIDPPDYVSGDATEALAAMIQDVNGFVSTYYEE